MVRSRGVGGATGTLWRKDSKESGKETGREARCGRRKVTGADSHTFRGGHIAWRGISFAEACRANSVLQFSLLGVSAGCPSSLLRFAFLRGYSEMLCFPMVFELFANRIN